MSVARLLICPLINSNKFLGNRSRLLGHIFFESSKRLFSFNEKQVHAVIAFRNPAEEKMMKETLENAATLKIFKIGLNQKVG